jgi:predicted RNase H-like HicB family nuclease
MSKDYRVLPIKDAHMKTYVFKILLEQDEDFEGNPSGWHVSCPALVEQGASSWGSTPEEALANIREVLEMTVESLVEHGEPIPVDSEEDVQVFEGSRVAVTI